MSLNVRLERNGGLDLVVDEGRFLLAVVTDEDGTGFFSATLVGEPTARKRRRGVS